MLPLRVQQTGHPFAKAFDARPERRAPFTSAPGREFRPLSHVPRDVFQWLSLSKARFTGPKQCSVGHPMVSGLDRT
jgi:hypothetical protein